MGALGGEFWGSPRDFGGGAVAPARGQIHEIRWIKSNQMKTQIPPGSHQAWRDLGETGNNPGILWFGKHQLRGSSPGGQGRIWDHLPQTTGSKNLRLGPFLGDLGTPMGRIPVLPPTQPRGRFGGHRGPGLGTDPSPAQAPLRPPGNPLLTHLKPLQTPLNLPNPQNPLLNPFNTP